MNNISKNCIICQYSFNFLAIAFLLLNIIKIFTTKNNIVILSAIYIAISFVCIAISFAALSLNIIFCKLDKIEKKIGNKNG